MFAALIPAIVSFGTLISAAPLPEVSTDLPFPEYYFTETAALVQNTYCGAKYNAEGAQVGNQTLLKSITLADDAQRVNIYSTDNLGLVIAYQGTNFSNMDSLAHDFQVTQVSPIDALGLTNSSKIFLGWQDQFQKSWCRVKNALCKLRKENPGKKLQVIGHSQGAALAQLAALAIEHSFGGDFIDKVISYGPPRVGNPSYASEFDSRLKGKYTGVTNGNDWVVTVPPRPWGFQHPSGLVWITPANGTDFKYFENGEDPRGPDSVDMPIITSKSVEKLPFLILSDHTGYYMKTHIGGSDGPCPAQLGGY